MPQTKKRLDVVAATDFGLGMQKRLFEVVVNVTWSDAAGVEFDEDGERTKG